MDSNVVNIALGGKHGKGKFVIVDQCDVELVSKYSWRLSKGYVLNGKNKEIHRLIVHSYREIPKGHVVDHINGNPLDNRRCNLEPKSHKANLQNSVNRKKGKSKYWGVSKHGNYWQARYAEKYLGNYISPEHAAAAYDRHVISLYGSHGQKLNNVVVTEEGRIPTTGPRKGIKKEKNMGETTYNQEGIAVIKTSSGKDILVDEEDWHKLKSMGAWYIDGRGYATTNKNISMHVLLLGGTIDGRVVDHKDHNKLNNQKSNLSYVTYSFNTHNSTNKTGSSSNYKGVSLTRSGTWRTQIRHNGICYSKNWPTEEEAAYDYDCHSFLIYGDRPNNMAKPSNWKD